MFKFTRRFIAVTAVCILSIEAFGGGKSLEIAQEAQVAKIPVVEVSSWYVGGSIAAATLKKSCAMYNSAYEDTTYGIGLRAGYDFGRYVGVELRGAHTFLDKGPLGGAPLSHIGLYAKAQYPFAKRWNFYTLLGYGYTKNQGEGARLRYFDSRYGFGYGVGIEFDLSDPQGDLIEDAHYKRAFDGHANQNKGRSLYVEYNRFTADKDTAETGGVFVGIRYDF